LAFKRRNDYNSITTARGNDYEYERIYKILSSINKSAAANCEIAY